MQMPAQMLMQLLTLRRARRDWELGQVAMTVPTARHGEAA